MQIIVTCYTPSAGRTTRKKTCRFRRRDKYYSAVQIRVRFLLLYFLMTDSIESAAQYVIEFHTAAASFFPICFVFPIQFFISTNFTAGHIRWRALAFPGISRVFAD